MGWVCICMVEKSMSFKKNNRYVMRSNQVVAELDSSNNVLSFSKFAPYLIQSNTFSLWEKSREVDVNRTNLRFLRRMLGLGSRDTTTALKKIYYASLFDTFWIKNVNSQLAWDDVKFTENKLFKHALCGDDITEDLEFKSPEHSNIGSFEKGWKLRDNQWYLCKTGTKEELWSELFSSKLLRKYLGDFVVEYWLEDNYIACKNFIDQDRDECLEHYNSIGGSDLEDNTVIAKFTECGLGQFVDNLKLMWYADALVQNGDRHEFNFGVITSQDTVRFAPIYDFNLSMVAYRYPTTYYRFEDVLIKSLKQLNFVKPFVITVNDIKDIYLELLEISEVKINSSMEQISEFILTAQEHFH